MNTLPIALAFALSQMLLTGCFLKQKERAPISRMDDYSIPPEVEEKAENFMAQQRYNEALNLIRPYADKGNPEAQFSVAFILVQRDEEKANGTDVLNWTRKAASKGHRHALEVLSHSYRYGHFNLPTNREMAEMWRSALIDTNRIPECLRFERTVLPSDK